MVGEKVFGIDEACQGCSQTVAKVIKVPAAPGPSCHDIEVNERGGKQSRIVCRYDLVDSLAIHRLALILHEGAEKYGEDNWRQIPARSHINHALRHIYMYLDGAGDDDDYPEDHLGHAFCRLMMACRKDMDGD